MSLASLLIYMGFLAIAAATPGPAVAAILARVLGRGHVGAVAFTTGIACGDLVWLTFSILGLTVIAHAFQSVFLVIRYAGASYLLYLAWRLWSAPVRATEIAADRTAESRLRLFLTGLSINLGNPKVMVFYLALLPAFVDLARIDVLSYAELILATSLTLTFVFGTYIAAASRARGLFARPKARCVLNRATGGVMAGAAAAIVAG